LRAVASDRRELLRRVPLFAELDRRELDEVASSLRERKFSQGENVLTEGRAGVGFFVIVDGEASVTVRGENRARLGPGNYFGEIALITGSERTATVTAESDMTCLALTAWEFRPIVEQNGTVAWKLLAALAKKLPGSEHSSS
jgi:CRP/FNR family cyclic AMP-dependent transcriptional regulator